MIPESQGVWWVNIRLYIISCKQHTNTKRCWDIKNGGSYFASVNLQTNGLIKNKYLNTSNTLGSFNTVKIILNLELDF